MKTSLRTCISKRVKCDEQHPRCGRCVRLQLQCEWAAQKLSLATRRRGLGPIKDRDGWTPRAIQPRANNSSTAGSGGGDGDGDGDGDGSVAAAASTPIQGATQVEAGESSQRLLQSASSGGTALGPVRRNHRIVPEVLLSSQASTPSATSSADIGEASDSPNSMATPESLATIPILPMGHAPNVYPPRMSQTSDLSLESGIQHQAINHALHFPLSFPLHSLTSAHYPSASTALFFASAIGAEYAPSIGSSDLQAVSFHRVVFAPLKSTRNASSSAHSLFLDRALQNSMALHFLLAVSHSELAIHLGSGVHIPQESWSHFQRGSQLFLQALDPLAQPDHVAMMLSLLYMYMFWMRHNPLNFGKLREVSAKVLAYVKTYNLDEFCANASLPELGSTSMPDQVLLSRILTYLYDRDGFCGFFGCGGAFASYVSENHDKRRRVWQLSRTRYPWSDEQAASALGIAGFPEFSGPRVMGVYFDLISIHHDINCYSQAPEPQSPASKAKIRRSLDRIQEEQPFLMNLIADCERQVAAPSLMALVTVTFYHALQIYFFRSRNTAFGELPLSLQVQRALNELVAAAYYTIATGPVQLLERFQWSLLIAGVETRDPVHLEWVLKNISDPGMKSVLDLVQEAKMVTSVTMEKVRQIISRWSSV